MLQASSTIRRSRSSSRSSRPPLSSIRKTMRLNVLLQGSSTRRLPCRRTRRPSSSNWKESSKRSTRFICKRKLSLKSASRPFSIRKRSCSPAKASPGGLPNLPLFKKASSSLPTT
ncbi:hypothetical protein L209DRAFT_417007 [Thermothelomyces heterothallicus CBS 203.75]